MKKAKKKLRTRTKFVILSIVCIVLFTAAALYVNAKGNSVQDSLIAGVFSFFGGELFCCLGIKLKDNKKKTMPIVEPITDDEEGDIE